MEETETTRKIGGNKFAMWYGNLLVGIGQRYIIRGTKTLISNPTCKFINPFTLIVNFTVDNTKKYQIVTQGDYKDRYKKESTNENPLDEKEMFMIITDKKGSWFLKE